MKSLMDSKHCPHRVEFVGKIQWLTLNFLPHSWQNNKLWKAIKIFTIQSRLQLLECDSLLHTWYLRTYAKKCKLCNNPSDTFSISLKKIYIDRHNRFVDLVFEKIKHFMGNNEDVLFINDKFVILLLSLNLHDLKLWWLIKLQKM